MEEHLKLIECIEKYWEFVRKLRNDPRVQDGFIEKTNISTEEQISYMNKYSSCFRVCLLNENPVGFIGVIENDIRICTHPDYQNLGIGKFMIKEIKKIFPKAYAKVKINNEISKKMFKSMGFKEKYIIFES